MSTSITNYDGGIATTPLTPCVASTGTIASSDGFTIIVKIDDGA